MTVAQRPSWDEYFMEIAGVVAKRTTCLRRSVGAVIVKDNRLLTSGYNGAPQGLAHCREVGCRREVLQIPSGERHELCRGAHAEQNAIVQAACHGVSIAGGTLYVTAHPCSACAKMIINAGIRRIVYGEGYPDPLAVELIQQAGLECVRLTGLSDG
ncbi:MAG TPA: cytidine/deoxycytidylate deaminase family protein [Patescibacteria group bacterium]|nr:cytidine/deoxycytidylate deaminase family protein [Patescibacteria group bacterium]